MKLIGILHDKGALTDGDISAIFQGAIADLTPRLRCDLRRGRDKPAVLTGSESVSRPLRILDPMEPPYPLGWWPTITFMQPELEAVLRTHVAQHEGAASFPRASSRRIREGQRRRPRSPLASRPALN